MPKVHLILFCCFNTAYIDQKGELLLLLSFFFVKKKREEDNNLIGSNWRKGRVGGRGTVKHF